MKDIWKKNAIFENVFWLCLKGNKVAILLLQDANTSGNMIS